MASFSPSRNYVRYVILLLALMLMLNQLDRLVIAVLAEPIRRELNLNDTELGLLTGFAFAVFYTFCGVPLALLADRWDRSRLLAICLALWSSMTAVCGMAGSFGQLLLARVGVAVGEAGCQPAAHSLISDYVPPERRVSAFALMSAGGSAGIMLSLIVGGLLAETVGWRWTIVIVGLTGLPVAAAAWFTLREPRRVLAAKTQAEAAGFAETWRHLIQSRTYVLLVISSVLCLLPTVAVTAWAPAFFMRSHGMTVGEMGLQLGIASGIGNLAGSVLAGFLSDYLGRREPSRVMLVPMFSMLACGPLFSLAFLAEGSMTAIAYYVLGAALYTSWYGPVFATVQTTTPPRMRAQAAAIALFVNCLVGVGLGPTLTGVLSDLLAPVHAQESLRIALVVMANLTVFGALGAWMTSRSMRREALAGPVRSASTSTLRSEQTAAKAT